MRLGGFVRHGLCQAAHHSSVSMTSDLITSRWQTAAAAYPTYMLDTISACFGPAECIHFQASFEGVVTTTTRWRYIRRTLEFFKHVFLPIYIARHMYCSNEGRKLALYSTYNKNENVFIYRHRDTVFVYGEAF